MARGSKVKSIFGNLILLGAALLVAGIIGELVVRFVYPTDRLEYEADDEVIWRLRPNQSGWVDLGGSMRSLPARINSLGFRGPEFAPKQSATRVLALGDSYTFGSGVADEETFSHQIQRISGERFSVINAGVPGWGVFQMQIRLHQALASVQPKFVLVTIPELDVYRQPLDPAATRSAVRMQRFKNAIRRYSRLITLTWRFAEGKYLEWSNRATLNSVSPAPQGTTGSSAAGEPQGPSTLFKSLWQLDRARILEMRDRAAAQGARLIVAGWPQRTRDTEYFLSQIAALNQEGIIGVDLSRSLGDYSEASFIIAGDGHPSPLGHATAARQLTDVLLALQPR